MKEQTTIPPLLLGSSHLITSEKIQQHAGRRFQTVGELRLSIPLEVQNSPAIPRVRPKGVGPLDWECAQEGRAGLGGTPTCSLSVRIHLYAQRELMEVSMTAQEPRTSAWGGM